MVLLLCLATIIGGCGWHLRGSQTLAVSLPPVYVEFHDVSGELRRELTQVLTAAEVSLVEQAGEAGLVLTLHDEQRGRRVLAVDNTGRVSEYELQYTLAFSVRDDAGQMLIPRDSIVQRRDYRFDESQVLAKTEEENKLFDFMRRMSIQALMRRLHTINAGAQADMPAPSDADPQDAD